jgi:hypothetical protein
MIKLNHGSATAQQVASQSNAIRIRAKARRIRLEELNREQGIIINLN